MKNRDAMVETLAKEIAIRKNELDGEIIETIYFGGGTPSVLGNDQIAFLINTVYENHTVSQNPEITLEANPDDLSPKRIIELSESKINRLSIGIQSFFDDDLKMMNRAHNAAEAKACLDFASKYFDNISVDLIYGTPGMSNERWMENVNKVLNFGVPHISAYALTVEEKTALHKMVKARIVSSPKDEVAQQHFSLLIEKLEEHGFIHYELSNFGKEGYFSKNNTAYWLGKKYIGIGPSAHSFNGHSRSWNVSNNTFYLKAITAGELPIEREKLSIADRYNEYVMTGLRTIWGVSLQKIDNEFGKKYAEYIVRESQKFLGRGMLELDNDILKTTTAGKFLTDGIASDLFFLNLED
jgi:oxygen-independent coproporphyrinogen III oxidase